MADYYSKVPAHGASCAPGPSREAEMKHALSVIRSDAPSRKEQRKMRSGAAMTGSPMRRDAKDR